MNENNYITITTKSKIIVIIILIISFIIGMLNMNTFIVSSRDKFTAKPLIKQGEFNICLTYELNGEVRKIDDVVICKYGGIEFKDASGMKRKWNLSLKSGNDEIVILDLSGQNIKDNFGNTISYFYFAIGNGAYYMGDPIWQSIPGIDNYVEYRYIVDRKNSLSTFLGLREEYASNIFTAEDAYEKFGIRLISWECDPPIENSFIPPIEIVSEE